MTIDLLLQSSIILLLNATSTLSLGPVFYALAFVAGLHALVIWFMIGTAGRQYAKDVARAQKT
ncbi:hypothetical protein D3C78_1970500 [compost metagenome]